MVHWLIDDLLPQVTDASDGHLHVRATMAIPSLQQSSSSADDSDPACQPVVKLWPDGQRAAIGNAAHEMVWVLDVQSARVTAELAGKEPWHLLFCLLVRVMW